MFALRRFTGVAGKAVRCTVTRGVLTTAGRALPKALTASTSFGAPHRYLSNLSEVLATELVEAEAENENDQDLRDITKQISKLFSITDKPGNAQIILHRKFKSEEIFLNFHCQDENTDFNAPDGFNEEENENNEGDADMGGDYGVDFTLTIIKGQNKMEFICNAGQQININQMRFVPSGVEGTEIDEKLYRGPQFDNLDETLQDSMIKFLAERGIDEDMSFFIISYARDKEEREYKNWLKTFIQFVE